MQQPLGTGGAKIYNSSKGHLALVNTQLFSSHDHEVNKGTATFIDTRSFS